MATPTQDALRRALRGSFLSRSAQATRRAARPGPAGGGGPWRPLAALRPAAARSNHPDVRAKRGRGTELKLRSYCLSLNANHGPKEGAYFF